MVVVWVVAVVAVAVELLESTLLQKWDQCMLSYLISINFRLKLLNYNRTWARFFHLHSPLPNAMIDHVM